MFLEKYKPKTIALMTGNRLQAGELKRAIVEWTSERAVLVSGPPGCGKTLAIGLIAKELGFEVVTGTIDDMVESSKQSSMWVRGKVLVADMDGNISPGDASELIENSKWPVVLVTTDVYQRNLADLRKDKRIKIIAFQKAGVSDLASLLKHICSAESIICNDRALYELAQRSDGDVRWAMIALESLSAVSSDAVQDLDKDRIERIFDTLDSVFKRKQPLDDTDLKDLFPWIVENLSERYTGNDLARAYRCVADANRFMRCGLDKYSRQFMVMMPTSLAYAQYKLPRWTSGTFAVEGAHCSARKARAYLQVFNRLQSRAVKRDGADA